MQKIAFSFVSLQQQRPDLPRLLVSTAIVDYSLSPYGMLDTCVSIACSDSCIFTWWWLLLASGVDQRKGKS
jgi:hypothetical protein